MQIHTFSILCVLIWSLVAANDFAPKVTKSHLESSHKPNYFDSGSFYRFGESETLMFHIGSSLQISFDNGEHWRSINVLGNDVANIQFDEFHHERAFVMGNSGNFHVTEDQGKTWKQISIPKEMEERGNCFPESHPLNRSYLLLHCNIMHGSSGVVLNPGESSRSFNYMETIAYASNDAGESFRRIVAPVDGFEATPDLPMYGTRCSFATSSAESMFDSNGLFCIYEVEKKSDIQEWSSNLYGIENGEGAFQASESLQPVSYTVGTLFYTSDFGKSTRTFDELKDFSVEYMWILPSKILVVTSGGTDADRTRDRLWISTGGPFKLAHLPEGVTSFSSGSDVLLESDPKRILLLANVEGDDENREYECLLISDPSGLNFTFANFPINQQGYSMQLDELGNHKRSIWGRFSFEKVVNTGIVENAYGTNFDKEISWFERFIKYLKELFFGKTSYPNEDVHTFTEYESYLLTRASFDNGKTWTNPRVVDPSGKHKHLFNCDIDDVEHCSFQENNYYFSASVGDPTAGIVIKTGVVGESAIFSDEENLMTFISRDGGASWEVAFEYAVYTAFLDFGSIIIAVPEEGNGLYTKFFFSLDQGRNWKEYYFNEPVHADYVEINSWGLKAVIRFNHIKRETTEDIFYSIDFSGVYNGRACVEEDLETWYLSNGNCIDGVRYSFNRRKPEAQCLMKKTFENLTLNEEMCDR